MYEIIASHPYFKAEFVPGSWTIQRTTLKPRQSESEEEQACRTIIKASTRLHYIKKLYSPGFETIFLEEPEEKNMKVYTGGGLACRTYPIRKVQLEPIPEAYRHYFE